MWAPAACSARTTPCQTSGARAWSRGRGQSWSSCGSHRGRGGDGDETLVCKKHGQVEEVTGPHRTHHRSEVTGTTSPSGFTAARATVRWAASSRSCASVASRMAGAPAPLCSPSPTRPLVPMGAGAAALDAGAGGRCCRAQLSWAGACTSKAARKKSCSSCVVEASVVLTTLPCRYSRSSGKAGMPSHRSSSLVHSALSMATVGAPCWAGRVSMSVWTLSHLGVSLPAREWSVMGGMECDGGRGGAR
jgi:hypothetical protein